MAKYEWLDEEEVNKDVAKVIVKKGKIGCFIGFGVVALLIVGLAIYMK